jgi:hypothetical protein
MDQDVTMLKPLRIQRAEAIGPTRLRIAWTTGERLEVDLAEPINRLQALAPLRDPAIFARVQVGEWGHSLVWEDEIDLGADRLYERCKEQAGEFSPGQFDAWESIELSIIIFPIPLTCPGWVMGVGKTALAAL